MDKDVESKMDKLCFHYQQAAAEVGIAKPVRAPTTKDRRRTETKVASVFSELADTRKPQVAALVKLAYVRGLRSVQPGAKLGPEQELEVTELEGQLGRALWRVERYALEDFRTHLRKLRAAKSLEELKTNPAVVDYIARKASAPYPLEQYARASVRSVVEMASAAGALAGAEAGSYDSVAHG